MSLEPETTEQEAPAEVTQEAAEEVDAENAPEAAAEAAEEAPVSKKPRLTPFWLVTLIASICLVGLSLFVIVTALFPNLIQEKPGTGPYALKISETKYSLGEVNFTYMNIFQQVYSQYAMYMTDILPDDPYTMGDGEMDTWGDFYMEQTKQHLQQVTLLYEMAQKDNYKLGEAELQDVEDYIQSMKDSAAAQGEEDFDAFLAENFGEGVTEDAVRSIFVREMTAMSYIQHYQDNLKFSEDDIDAAYEADKDTYDTYYFAIHLVEPEGAEDADPTEEALAAAKAEAERMMAAAQEGEGDALERMQAACGEDALVEELQMDGGMLASNSVPFEAWLKDSARAEGDMTVSEMTGYGSFVVLFLGRERSDTPTVNVRHILILAEDADGDGEISDAEYDVAKAQLEQIQAEWEAGDKSEDSFAALAEQYSDDPGSASNGGLYEDVYEGQMVPAFNDFCFDPARKAGDVGLVQNTTHQGYHLIYFVGTGEPYTDKVISSALAEKAMSEFVDNMTNNLPEVIEGRDFASVGLPASLLEQLEQMKTTNSGTEDSDVTLPEETDETAGDGTEAEAPEESAAP